MRYSDPTRKLKYFQIFPSWMSFFTTENTKFKKFDDTRLDHRFIVASIRYLWARHGSSSGQHNFCYLP